MSKFSDNKIKNFLIVKLNIEYVNHEIKNLMFKNSPFSSQTTFNQYVIVEMRVMGVCKLHNISSESMQYY